MANNSEIFLSIDLRRNRFRISMYTLRSLKNPTYIQFLINPEEGFIAILGSEKPIIGGSANRIEVANYKNKGFNEFYSQNLMDGILDIMGPLDNSYSYRLKGDIDKLNRVAYFSMNTIKKHEAR